jgi:hypothetical protein
VKQLQTQTLNNIAGATMSNGGSGGGGGGLPVTSSLPLNPAELLYSNAKLTAAKSPRVKKVMSNGNTGTNGTPILDDDDSDMFVTSEQQQKTIDLTHIL